MILGVIIMAKKLKLKKPKRVKEVKFFVFKDRLTSFDLSVGTHIEIFSNKKAFVENCMGVYEYCETTIKINTGKGSVIFSGEQLEISALQGKNLNVDGKITSIEFCL